MAAEGVNLATRADGTVRLAVRARPNARRSGFAGVREGALVVDLAAPPARGAANEELQATLARALGLPKRDIVLVRGAGGRNKSIDVLGLRLEDVRARLERALADVEC
jgi:uncharacterized protein YggU (UPF0235/DUF167 family)